MIDISDKKVVFRDAMATGTIHLKTDTIAKITSGEVKKGDVLETAKIAGTMAVKNTSGSIPYCHPVPVSAINYEFKINRENIESLCQVRAIYRTGVEMEAINGVLTSLLTIWDMVKYLEKDDNGNYPETSISNVHVVYKKKEEINAPQ